jgi:hypothetical protein
MLTQKELDNKLVELNRLDLLGASAARDKAFYEILDKIDFNTAVEIGTYKGLSTVVLASKAKMVYTFDVYDWEEKDFIWDSFGFKDKIKSFVLGKLKSKDMNIKGLDGWAIVGHHIDRIASRQNINKKLQTLDFDFAFIDGWHDYENVKKDFEIVKKCGKVLFHDYTRYLEINKFCDEIGAKPIGCFAYWEK